MLNRLKRINIVNFVIILLFCIFVYSSGFTGGYIYKRQKQKVQEEQIYKEGKLEGNCSCMRLLLQENDKNIDQYLKDKLNRLVDRFCNN